VVHETPRGTCNVKGTAGAGNGYTVNTKFKVGDRVRVVRIDAGDTEYTLGEELTVQSREGKLYFFGRVCGLYHTQLALVTHTETAPAPPHYLAGRPAQYEPRFVIAAWGLGYNLGSAVKYISRFGRKGAEADHISDLEKARDFLKFEIARLKGAEFYGKAE
jgi:hypothetical protein